MAKYKEPICRYCEQAETVDGLIGEVNCEREINRLLEKKIKFIRQGIQRAMKVASRNPAKAIEILAGLVEEKSK